LTFSDEAILIFLGGDNWPSVFNLLGELDILDLEITASHRYITDRDVYKRFLQFLKVSPASYGIKVYSIHTYTGDISAQDEGARQNAVDLVKRQVEELCGYIRPEVAVVHPTGNSSITENAEDKEIRYAKCHQSLYEINGYCQKFGLKIAVENMRRKFSDEGLVQERIGCDVEELADLVNQLGSENVGICYDTGHANISHGPVFYDTIPICRDRILLVHASDNFGRDDDHLIPGQGRIDWSRVFQQLKEIDFRGPVIVEAEPGKEVSLIQGFQDIGRFRGNFIGTRDGKANG